MDGEYKSKNIKLGNQRREQRNPKQQYGVAFPSSKAILHFIVQQRRYILQQQQQLQRTVHVSHLKKREKKKTNQSRPYKCNELSKGKRRDEGRKQSFYNIVHIATLIYAITLGRTILITSVTTRLAPLDNHEQ